MGQCYRTHLLRTDLGVLCYATRRSGSLLCRHPLGAVAVPTRDKGAAVRKLATVSSGTAAVSVVAAVGWPGLILALAVIVFVVAGVCWVLNDAGRAKRLARLIRELRGRRGPDDSA